MASVRIEYVEICLGGVAHSRVWAALAGRGHGRGASAYKYEYRITRLQTATNTLCAARKPNHTGTYAMPTWIMNNTTPVSTDTAAARLLDLVCTSSIVLQYIASYTRRSISVHRRCRCRAIRTASGGVCGCIQRDTEAGRYPSEITDGRCREYRNVGSAAAHKRQEHVSPSGD